MKITFFTGLDEPHHEIDSWFSSDDYNSEKQDSTFFGGLLDWLFDSDDSDFSDDIDGSFQDEDALITPVKPWDVFVVNSIF